MSTRRPTRCLSLVLCSSTLLGACTVVKPVVCTFTHPIDVMRRALAVPDDDDDHADIPAPLVLVTAPVLIPLRFAGLAVMGFAGGLVSGFASDLNVITWNFDHPLRNLTRPFKTNARKPE
jgi:hypothetical protein